MSEATHAACDGIVLGGAYQNNGVPGFGQILNKGQSDAVYAFVVSGARFTYERQRAMARYRTYSSYALHYIDQD